MLINLKGCCLKSKQTKHQNCYFPFSQWTDGTWFYWSFLIRSESTLFKFIFVIIDLIIKLYAFWDNYEIASCKYHVSSQRVTSGNLKDRITFNICFIIVNSDRNSKHVFWVITEWHCYYRMSLYNIMPYSLMVYNCNV
jgi:hypothetical protein